MTALVGRLPPRRQRSGGGGDRRIDAQPLTGDLGNPDIRACLIAATDGAVPGQPLVIAVEQVGRKRDGVHVAPFLTGLQQFTCVWLAWASPDAAHPPTPVELPEAVTMLSDPAAAQKVLKRLYNVFARLANQTERARFPMLAEPAVILCDLIEDTRDVVIEHVSIELRRRDAWAATEHDPSLTLEEAADRYGFEGS